MSQSTEGPPTGHHWQGTGKAQPRAWQRQGAGTGKAQPWARQRHGHATGKVRNAWHRQGIWVKGANSVPSRP